MKITKKTLIWKQKINKINKKRKTKQGHTIDTWYNVIIPPALRDYLGIVADVYFGVGGDAVQLLSSPGAGVDTYHYKLQQGKYVSVSREVFTFKDGDALKFVLDLDKECCIVVPVSF